MVEKLPAQPTHIDDIFAKFIETYDVTKSCTQAVASIKSALEANRAYYSTQETGSKKSNQKPANTTKA